MLRHKKPADKPDVYEKLSADTKPKSNGRFKRLRAFIERHRLATLLICGVILIWLGCAAAFCLTYKAPVATTDSTPVATKKKAEPTKYYSPLSGVEVADEAATKSAVTAVMIENSPDARPQSGLKQAEVVYEAIAEGGITRFLVLYQQNKPSLVGPVRSLRMYYVDWLAPYQASVAHVGGSAAALAEIRNGSYRDIDQFFNANSYWRASDRYAPHNVYTNFENLDALNAAKGYTSSEFTGFARADGKASDTPNATSIDLNFSSALYNTHYDYDAASNTYLRSIGGQTSDDREEGRIAPSVIIALHVDETTVLEDGWRQSIITTGSGKADIFQNGTVIEATWQKTDRASQLKFVDAEGKEIALNRGQTWIGAIANNGGSVSWQ